MKKNNPSHVRSQSAAPTEDFKLFKKKKMDQSNKENVPIIQNQNQAQNQISKSIEDKLEKLDQQIVSNESYNDQFLLSSLEHSVSNKKKKSQKQNQSCMGSISFHLISNENQAILSQQDFQIPDEPLKKAYDSSQEKSSVSNPMNRFRSSSNNKIEKSNGKNVQFSSNQYKSQFSQADNGQILNMLLGEFENRFQYLEDRLEKNERISKQTNQDNKYTYEITEQLQEKISQINKRLGKIEYKQKVIEDLFIQHKNMTDKRIIDYNQHVNLFLIIFKKVDQSLKQFINSSMKIQNKIDSLSLGSHHGPSNQSNNRNDKELDQLKFAMKDLEEKQNEKAKTINKLQFEFDSIHQKVNIVCENLGSTHNTLQQQLQEFSSMQKKIQQVKRIYINLFFQLSDFNIKEIIEEQTNEIDQLKEYQNEIVSYLHTLQESLSNPF